MPDKPFNARETLALWQRWHHKLRRQYDRFDNLADVRKPWLGLAFAAQDGQESPPLPEEAGWVFIAGSTEWKLPDAAASVMQRARDVGMYIHVGRVNSQKRYRHFQRLAEHLDLDIVSCDGTAARFDPARALYRLTHVLYESGMIRGYRDLYETRLTVVLRASRVCLSPWIGHRCFLLGGGRSLCVAEPARSTHFFP